MTRHRGESGFTLVEILIVAVLGALLVGATLQIMITNQRAYTASQAQIRGQQTVRAGLEVLFGELREISTAGGDILEIDADTIAVRVMRTFGITCQVDIPGADITVTREGGWFEAGDSIVVFADNDITMSRDDAWLIGEVTSVDTIGETCGSETAQELNLASMATEMGNDSIKSGAPVRAFTHYTYGLAQVSGDWYLSRWTPGNDAVPMVGPVRSPTDGGVRFEYLDEDGDPTTVLADIAQIQVTLRTEAAAVDSKGDRITDSITARIYPRN